MYHFSRGHATLHLAMLVGPSVRPSVSHISELRAVFALQLLPNCPRLDCRVSGLVFKKATEFSRLDFLEKIEEPQIFFKMVPRTNFG